MRLREHDGIIPGRIDILYCKPDAITVEDGYNVRDLTTPEARAELDELKASVKENGILTPLKVRFNAANEQIILVEGHRRRAVALELIAEHEKSGGTEGRWIESVPIYPEPPGTDAVDRDFGLETSNSGTRLKPLELANLLHRLHTQRGLPLEEIAKRLGKTLNSIKGTLALRAMPEEAKEQVRAGVVSATMAAKLQKEDPEFVAELHRKNEEENKKLGKGQRAKRITPKTVSRAKAAELPKKEPKPEPASALAATSETSQSAPIMHPTAEVEPQTMPHPADGTPSVAETMSEGRDGPAPQPHPQLQEVAARELPIAAFHPPTRASDLDGMMFAIIKSLAAEAESFDLAELEDSARVEVPASILKAADRFYRERIGDETQAAA